MPYQQAARGGLSPGLVLEGLTTCVNYADFLDESLSKNIVHFDDFLVITTPDDKQTAAVCQKHSVRCLKTDVFSERSGHRFCKGKAIDLGIAHLPHEGWLLHLDADIVLPDRFRWQLQQHALDARCIYGADRVNVIGSREWDRIQQYPVVRRQFSHRYLIQTPPKPIAARVLHHDYGWCPIGYFQLWHASAGRRYPHNQGSAEHTDLLFALQWPRQRRRLLPELIVYHLESEAARMGTNWSGRKTQPFRP